MKKIQLILLSATAMVLTSCSGKLGALSSDYFTVTPNPLETQQGQVPATISGVFPEKYMQKKAVVTVTPELRFNGQRVKGQSATFQGEKVMGNDQSISYKAGGRYDMKSTWQYVPEMAESELYLTFDAKVGNKKVEVPEVKVATGVLATTELYMQTATTAAPALATDAYQRVFQEKQEANIQFLIGQANLRKSELQNNSVKEFVRLLNDIVADQEGRRLDNIEIAGFASPDGGYDINEKLADKRQGAASQYVKQQMKKAALDAPVDTKYTAEDWEGFQQLVAASNIQDKDVILRVLSMYKDPEEREAQIRKISSAFSELADGILPQLSRSRLIANYEIIGRSDEQIKEQLNADASKLNIEEILYAANLYSNEPAKAEEAYKKATQLFPNDARAFNNLAMLAYEKGDYDQAKQWAQKALNINKNLPEANANLGMLSLLTGDTNTAESLISKGTNANGANEVLGNLHLAQGKYAQAEQDFKGIQSNSAALAQILNKNYQAAASTLKNVKNPDGMTDYLTAIVNARMGNTSAAQQALKSAIAKDPSLAEKAAKDLELMNISK